MTFKKRLQDFGIKIKEEVKNPDFQALLIVAVGQVVIYGMLIRSNRRYCARLETWSFGLNSALKIKATPEEASMFNRFVRAYVNNQKREFYLPGEPWHPVEYLSRSVLGMNPKTLNLMFDRLKEAIQEIDQVKTPIEILDEYLVKN